MHSQFELNNTCTTLHSQMHLQDQSLRHLMTHQLLCIVLLPRRSHHVHLYQLSTRSQTMQASGSHNIQVYTKASLVHQEQDMQLTQNQAYVTSASVSMKPNECYGTTTPSMDSDLLYATVEGEHNTTHTSQQPKEEDYDYIIA